MSAYPSSQHTTRALLLLLYEQGRGLHPTKAYEALADLFELPQELRLLTEPRAPGGVWAEIVLKAARELIDAGYIERRPLALWRLTLSGFLEAVKILDGQNSSNQSPHIGKALQ